MLQRMFAYKVKQQKKMLNILLFFQYITPSAPQHSVIITSDVDIFVTEPKIFEVQNTSPPKKYYFITSDCRKRPKAYCLGVQANWKICCDVLCRNDTGTLQYFLLNPSKWQQPHSPLFYALIWHITIHSDQWRVKKNSRQPTSLSTVNNNLSDM